ncbi:hypothetical protein JMN32_05070 [Fulvivirga sp. 29W222]|uniref:Uncharacterized protein n=1 Tax=Fulvivirga marina TaxID=2494733 RepID=A0A937KCY2_9BACT|nr:hypothetical protein [Fulvivirga marina]MBL6445668.1 hypothetical protein [Fulvivirga marina]
MDLIFQFGDVYPVSGNSSFFENLLIAVIGAVIGSGAAIWIFYQTLKSDRKKSRKLKNQRDEELLRYFCALLRNILKFTNGQKQDYLNFAKALEAKPYETHLVRYRVNHDIRRVQKMNQHEIYQAYLDQMGSKDTDINRFTAIYSNLDFLDVLIDAARSENELGQKHITERRFQYKNEAEKLLNYVGLFIENIRKSNLETYTEIPVWVALNQLLGSYHIKRTDASSLTYVQQAFVKPVGHTIMNDFRDLPECTEIMQLVKKATHTFSNIKLDSSELANSFQEYYSEFNKIEDELRTKSNQLLRKYSVKSEEQLAILNINNE